MTSKYIADTRAVRSRESSLPLLYQLYLYGSSAEVNQRCSSCWFLLPAVLYEWSSSYMHMSHQRDQRLISPHKVFLSKFIFCSTFDFSLFSYFRLSVIRPFVTFAVLLFAVPLFYFELLSTFSSFALQLFAVQLVDLRLFAVPLFAVRLFYVLLVDVQ
jgi:hypothetical protein